ncbi:hypothetical protein M0802_016134, partial [Mischocyttarus mexicanus]
DCESNFGNLENDTVSEESESGIRPPKFRKRNIIVSDSDNELEEEWNEHDMTPNLPNYLNIPGATIELGDALTISEVADLFFDKTFFDWVVTQTNLYYFQMKPLHKISTKTATMSGMRFKQILTFFHLNDNTERIVPQDKLSKIKPLLNYIIPKYQALYILKQKLASDKAMIPFRELISFRTYNQAKITKYGILIRMLCESESDRAIDQEKTLVCGTIRKNHGLPKVLLEKSKSLHRGEMTFLRKGPVVFIAWKDKRIVSTIYDASMNSSGNRKKNYKDDTIKPTCILQYNKHMKGVDRADQYLANSSIFRKTVKSYKKLAFFLINNNLFNAYKMYFTYRPESKIRYKKFLLEVAREWITVVSKECSTAPHTSGRSQTALSKDLPSRLSGQQRDHILQGVHQHGPSQNLLKLHIRLQGDR